MPKLHCTESNYLYITLVIIVLTSGLIFKIHRFPVWTPKCPGWPCTPGLCQYATVKIPRHWADVTVLLYYKTQRKQRCPSSHLTTFKKPHSADFNLCRKLNGYICVRMHVQANLHTLFSFLYGCRSNSVLVPILHRILLRISIRGHTMVFPNSLDRFWGWKPPGLGAVEL